VLTSIVAVWPLVGQYSPEDRSRLENELQTLEQELRQLEQQELTMSEKLQTGGSTLDLEQARKRREQQERNYQIKKHGSALIQAVIDRLPQKMLPRTEYYMQQLLPLLTCGRYHDVRLTTEHEEETSRSPEAETGRGPIYRAPGAFQLQVWEPAASEYIPKTALSSGAADQISLALRLAFAITALPRELNAAPGFILLDEPLSSFDRARMQAFVDIVTGDILGQHFEQILLISHNSAFDPALFPYHVYVDGGQVIESNLPVMPAPSLAESNGHRTGEDVGVPMPASRGTE
jgi:DNA repair exonuclease SbcCD ATPase subunit